MVKSKSCLVDSDFLIALARKEDASHKLAKKIFSERVSFGEIKITSLVLMEATTVMSHKGGMEGARKFYGIVKNLVDEIIFVDQELMEEGWEVFLKQTKKGTSFVDCANLATARKHKVDKILSFDKFYPKDLW